jgi:hypothetical protein
MLRSLFDLVLRLGSGGGRRPAPSTDVPASAIDLHALEARLRPFERTAWIPEVVEGDGPPLASKFSGAPALGRDEEWPLCGNCGRPMQLFVQLNAADLPEAEASRLLGGFLQLFYCTSSEPLCEVDCEAFFPHSRSTLVRLLPATSVRSEYGAASLAGMFPPKRIVGWKAATDVPGGDEGGDLGLELSDEEAESLDEAGRVPLQGEKLGGWPSWIQGVEYPSCRRCGQRMELLFQIDSEKNLPYMFGDAGIGHITQCREHRDEVAFGWACS